MIKMYYNSVDLYDTYGVIAKTTRRLLPQLLKRELTIQGRHGSYDFSDNTYSTFILPVLIQLKNTSLSNLRSKVRNVAAALRSQTYVPLFFSDEADKYYLAKIYDQSDLETFIKSGKATVRFECQPFALYQASSIEDVILDSFVPLESEITLDPGTLYVFEITDDDDLEIDYYGNQEIGLGSHEGSKFDITIDGSFSTLSIEVNGNTLNYNDAITDETVVIDNINATVEKDGSNAMSSVSGDVTEFLKLIPGANTISITGTDLDCTISIDFRAQYI